MNLDPPQKSPSSLNVATVRGTAAAVVSQALKFALNFAVGIALARLLTPSDFGLFGIAFAVAGLMEFARDGGLVMPVVQQTKLTRDERNTLFWYNSLVGVLLALVVLLAAPLVAFFFDEPRLLPIIAALAIVFLCGGVSTQYLVHLRRQMRFTTLACCELSALLLACIVAVVSAWFNRTYWSLVYFQLTREILQAVFVMHAGGWVPSRAGSYAAIVPLMRKGHIMMAFEILGALVFKIDNLVVAWFLGPDALGFYEKAYNLLLLPVNQINMPLSNVVHSSLSRLQNEPERFFAYIIRALNLSTWFGIPVTTFLLANAPTVVLQLFGPQWLPVVPVFQALAPAACLMPISAATGWIFLALDRAARQLPFSLFTTCVTVFSFFIGVHWGIVGVAIAFSVARVVLFVPTLMFTCAGTCVLWTALLKSGIRPVLGSMVAMMTSVGLDSALPVTYCTLPRNAVVFGVVYCLIWMILPGGRRLVQDNIMALRVLYHNV